MEATIDPEDWQHLPWPSGLERFRMVGSISLGAANTRQQLSRVPICDRVG